MPRGVWMPLRMTLSGASPGLGCARRGLKFESWILSPGFGTSWSERGNEVSVRQAWTGGVAAVALVEEHTAPVQPESLAEANAEKLPTFGNQFARSLERRLILGRAKAPPRDTAGRPPTPHVCYAIRKLRPARADCLHRTRSAGAPDQSRAGRNRSTTYGRSAAGTPTP